MAATVREKLIRATTSARSGSSSEVALKEETEKYKLMVTAGPSYDPYTHQVVAVNTDSPTIIDNDFLTAKLKVRVRQFRGLPSKSPPGSPYFDDPVHERDQYSIAFTFVPKQDLPCQDTVWGNDFDHPIRDKIPPLFNMAFRIVKEFIDPGLECDAYADEPWLYGPSLSCWFAFRIGDKIDSENPDFESPDDVHVMKEGGDGEGEAIRQRHHLPETGDKRRRHFLQAANRDAFTFEKGRLYSGDFYNPYIDFPNFSLKLPGFSLKVIKYVDQKSHCLRYVFKNRRTGDVYFNVNFHLLWGDQLQKAIQEDREGRNSVIWPGGVVPPGDEERKGVAAVKSKDSPNGLPHAAAGDDDDDDEEEEEWFETSEIVDSPLDVESKDLPGTKYESNSTSPTRAQAGEQKDATGINSSPGHPVPKPHDDGGKAAVPGIQSRDLASEVDSHTAPSTQPHSSAQSISSSQKKDDPSSSSPTPDAGTPRRRRTVMDQKLNGIRSSIDHTKRLSITKLKDLLKHN